MISAENNVYVIDPDEAVHDALTELLAAAGTRVVCFRNAEDFLKSLDADGALHGCLLVEANLPGMGSLAFLRQLNARGISVPVVVLTSTFNRDIADQALKAGALEVIAKPLVGERLLKFLRDIADRNGKYQFGQDAPEHA